MWRLCFTIFFFFFAIFPTFSLQHFELNWKKWHLDVDGVGTLVKMPASFVSRFEMFEVV